MADFDSFQWSSSIKAECNVVMSNPNVRKTSYKKASFIISIFVIFMLAGLVLMTTLIRVDVTLTEYVKIICQGLKSLLYKPTRKDYNVLLIYSEKDESYVVEVITPVLKRIMSLRVKYKPLNEKTIKKETFQTLIEDMQPRYAVNILYTPNYVDLIKTHPDFTEICEECIIRNIFFFVLSNVPSFEIDFKIVSSMSGHKVTRFTPDELEHWYDPSQRPTIGADGYLTGPMIDAQPNPC